MLKFKSLVVVAALLAGASASFAQETDPPLSREQVRAELQRAQQAGQLNGINEAWDGSNFTSTRPAAGVYGRPFAASPGLTREEVMAEYQRALKSGEIAQHRMTDGIGGH